MFFMIWPASVWWFGDSLSPLFAHLCYDNIPVGRGKQLEISGNCITSSRFFTPGGQKGVIDSGFHRKEHRGTTAFCFAASSFALKFWFSFGFDFHKCHYWVCILSCASVFHSDAFFALLFVSEKKQSRRMGLSIRLLRQPLLNIPVIID